MVAKKSIVASADALVVAINPRRLRHDFLDADPPRILQVAYAIGQSYVVIDPKTTKPIEAGRFPLERVWRLKRIAMLTHRCSKPAGKNGRRLPARGELVGQGANARLVSAKGYVLSGRPYCQWLCINAGDAPLGSYDVINGLGLRETNDHTL